MKKIEQIKNKIRERAPKVIAKVSIVVALSAVAAAAYYRNKYNGTLDVFDNHDETLEVHPEILREVREEGAVMKFKMDEHGNKFFTTQDDFVELKNEDA